MGARYLTDLAEVCRLTGYPVIELDGWESRARGSGGYGTGKPDHVMCHHTASPPSADGWGDANYCTFADDDAPLANIVLSRVPELFICAAGATNTNGSGDCPHLAPDTMNSSAVGVEACNDGLGEAWPEGQQSCYVAAGRPNSVTPTTSPSPTWRATPSMRPVAEGGPSRPVAVGGRRHLEHGPVPCRSDRWTRPPRHLNREVPTCDSCCADPTTESRGWSAPTTAGGWRSPKTWSVSPRRCPTHTTPISNRSRPTCSTPSPPPPSPACGRGPGR